MRAFFIILALPKYRGYRRDTALTGCIPADAPPQFTAVAADDYMPQSLRVFDIWNKHQCPVDTWTDRFTD
jgi:hypothetical protein